MHQLKNDLFAFQYRLKETLEEYQKLLTDMGENPTDDEIVESYNFYYQLRPIILKVSESGELLSNFIKSSDKLYEITDENKDYHKYCQSDLFYGAKENNNE